MIWHVHCFKQVRKEDETMKKAMFATMLLAAGTLFAAPRVAVGINIGIPAPVAVVRPVCPGPGYAWVDGYYGPTGLWVAGYWAPPAAAVVPVAPFYGRERVVVPARHFAYAPHREFRR